MLEKKEKSGLVLEGGAKLGVYSAGVVDVLMKRTIRRKKISLPARLCAAPRR